MQTPSPFLNNPIIEGNSPICKGATLKLETTYQEGIIYHWYNPLGREISVVNIATQPNIDSTMVGRYALVLEKNQQFSDTAFFEVNVVDRPPTPLISSNSPVCEKTTLRLEGPTITGATYRWFDPFGGILSAEEDPVLDQVRATFSGKYFLEVSYGGCTSLPGETDVGIIPVAPPELVVMPIQCVGDTLLIRGPKIAEATYFWTGPNQFFATGQDSILFPIATTDLNGRYRLTLSSEGCESGTGTATVELPTLPSAKLIGDSIVCRGTLTDLEIQLTGIPPFEVVYKESTQADTIVTIKKSFKFSPTSELSSQYQLISIVDETGCQGKVEGALSLRFKTNPKVRLLTDSVCNKDNYEVPIEITEGTPPYRIEGTEVDWTDNQSMAVFRSKEEPYSIQVIDANNCISELLSGIINCDKEEENLTTETSSDISAVIVDAGESLTLCGSTTTYLQAATPAENILGRWETESAAIILNPSAPTTQVKNLSAGANTFYWILSTNEYPDFKRDSVVYTYLPTPIARTDEVRLTQDMESIEIAVLKNDQLPKDYLAWTEVLEPPSNGVLENTEDDIFTFSKIFNGGATATFDYRLCYESAVCATVCDTAKVHIDIALDPFDPGVFVPDGFTPNGDGLNDYLELLGLEQYPTNELIVFDRWGNRIFQAQPYRNNWDGTWQQKDLPEGVYYYVLRTKIADKRTLKGEVYLLR